MNWSTRLKEPPSSESISFCSEHASSFNLDFLRKVSILRGRKYYGVYGWMECEGPLIVNACQIVLHLPGPFPHVMTILRKPIRRKILDLDLPDKTYAISRNVSIEASEVRISLRSKTELGGQDEGMVWLFGHELFHYLTHSKQLDKTDNEYNADEYGDFLLERWRSRK